MVDGELHPAIKAASRMWDHTGHQIFSFGPISDDELARIKAETGLELSGFSRFMATRGVRHIKNDHSNARIEAQRQQIAVNPSDFALIPEIAAQGEVRLVGQLGSRKPPRLEHCAMINNRVYVLLETISMSDKQLELWTMRIELLEKREL